MGLPRNRILLRGRHQGDHRLLPPDLVHRIESASSRREMTPEHNKTYAECMDVRDCLPSVSLQDTESGAIGINDPGRLGNEGDATRRTVATVKGDLMTGTLLSGAYNGTRQFFMTDQYKE